MRANRWQLWSREAKPRGAGGLVIPAVVAAVLMAAALMGCNDGLGSGHENWLSARAEAEGQNNGGLTDATAVTVEFERGAPRAVDHTPRVAER